MYFQASVIGTLFNFISRFIFSRYFSFGISVIFANYIGMIIVFLMSYNRVFRVGRITPSMLIRFAVVAHVGLFVVWLTALLCHAMAEQIAPWIFWGEATGFVLRNNFPDWTAVDFWTFFLPRAVEGLCHGTGIIAGFAINFLGHRYFSFQQNFLED